MATLAAIGSRPEVGRYPPVVIDGQNVAFAGAATAGGGRPSISALLAAVAFFDTGLGVDSVAFIPEYWLRSRPAADTIMRPASSRRREWALEESERAALQALLATGRIVTVPAKDPDDPYILSYAWARRGFVVSNDRFRDHAAKLAGDAAAADRSETEAAAAAFLMEEDGSALGSSHAASVAEKLAWLSSHVVSFALRPVVPGAAGTRGCEGGAGGPLPPVLGSSSTVWEFIPNPSTLALVTASCQMKPGVGQSLFMGGALELARQPPLSRSHTAPSITGSADLGDMRMELEDEAAFNPELSGAMTTPFQVLSSSELPWDLTPALTPVPPHASSTETSSYSEGPCRANRWDAAPRPAAAQPSLLASVLPPGAAAWS